MILSFGRQQRAQNLIPSVLGFETFGTGGVFVAPAVGSQLQYSPGGTPSLGGFLPPPQLFPAPSTLPMSREEAIHLLMQHAAHARNVATDNATAQRVAAHVFAKLVTPEKPS